MEGHKFKDGNIRLACVLLKAVLEKRYILAGANSCKSSDSNVYYTYREREAAKDAEDRRRETEEIEELKTQIFANPAFKDPGAEFQRLMRERERQFLPAGKLREQEAAAAAKHQQLLLQQQQLQQQQQQQLALQQQLQREREQRERTASPGRLSASPDDRGASPADSYNGGGGEEEDSRDSTMSPTMVPMPPTAAPPAILSQPVTVTGTVPYGTAMAPVLV
jgi:hypothetical protein